MHECCEAAVARGLSVIGVTEHVDFDPSDPGIGFFDYDACAASVESARSAWSGSLEVLFGVEIDYRSWFEDQIAAFLDTHRFDYVIGSVHAYGPVGAAASEDAAEAYVRSMQEVGLSASSGLFDVIGHCEYVLRRHGQAVRGGSSRTALRDREACGAAAEKALVQVIASGACLEVNSSGLRHGVGQPYPSAVCLETYRRLGGSLVTLGSDAHCPEDVGRDIALINGMVRRARLEATCRPRRRERRQGRLAGA